MNTKAVRPNIAAAVFSYACMVLLGAIVTIVNATLPQLSEAFALPVNRVSLLISCIGVGRLGTQVVCGAISDRFGRKVVVLTGTLLLVLFFAAMPFTKSFGLAVALCVVCGMGYGMMNTSMIALLFDCFAPFGKAATAQSYVQVLYALGGILTPLGASALLDTGLSWTYLYICCGGYAAILLAGQLLIRFPPPAQRTARESVYRIQPRLWHEGLLLTVTVFFVYGAQTVATTWLPTLAQNYVAMETSASVRMLSMYNAGAIVGSLIFAQLLRRFPPMTFLTINPFISLASFALCVLVPSQTVFNIAVFIAGSTTAILFNLSIGVGGEMFPLRAGTISGMISTASSTASLVIPAATSFMLDHLSMRATFSSIFVLMGVGICLVFVLRRRCAQMRAG